MWRVFWERFLQTSSSSSGLTEGPECPCGLAREERATQTHARSTSLSCREEADLPWRTRPIRRCENMKRKHLRYSYGFSSGHVWMWELDYKESWVPKNWCFWTMVLEMTLDSPYPRGSSQLYINVNRTYIYFCGNKLKKQVQASSYFFNVEYWWQVIFLQWTVACLYEGLLHKHGILKLI